MADAEKQVDQEQDTEQEESSENEREPIQQIEKPLNVIIRNSNNFTIYTK